MNQTTNLGTVLFIVFLVLKLTNVTAWSWWWVTSPLWIPWLIIGAILVVGLTIAGIVLLIAALIEVFSKK